MRTFAQFPPAAGQMGNTAIHKDSSVFVGWATGCTITRGYQDISNPGLGYAGVGDSSMAIGKGGDGGVVSLGDGGSAILTFENPLRNGPGWDFAVFENGFSDTYLELAFVEVSSDGLNYFRFPCTSYTQDTIQVGSFGSVDATKIDNLAGKYKALYGTPFDLQQLFSQTGLDVDSIRYIKITDVVGCIQDTFARKDQYGNKINDPWNTPYESSGFDLDAVGVIHNSTTGIRDEISQSNFKVFPNPAGNSVFLELNNVEFQEVEIIISDLTGKEVKSFRAPNSNGSENIKLDLSLLKNGIYIFSIFTAKGTASEKLVIANE